MCTVATWCGQCRGLRRLEGSPQWAVLGVVPWSRRGQECGPEPGLPCGPSLLCGPEPREMGRPAARSGRVSGGPACPRARAAGRVSQSAGGVLTGPRPARPRARAASRLRYAAGGVLTGPRSAPVAAPGREGPGPDDSDHAFAGAAGRVPRTGGSGAGGGRARSGGLAHVKVRDHVRLCFGSNYSLAGRVRAPRSRCPPV
jgi:hypothetical protein